MYTYKRFKTSKSVVTIVLIGLALVIWSNLGLAGQPTYRHDIPVEIYFFEDNDGYRIKSDASHPDNDPRRSQIYSADEKRVSAFLGRRRGQLILNTNTSKRPNSGRTLSLDFSLPVPPGDLPAEFPKAELLPVGFPVGEFFPERARINTGGPDDPNQPYQYDLRKMGKDGLPLVASMPLRIQFYFEEPLAGENVWWINFGDVDLAAVGHENDGASGDLVTVTREVEDNPGTPEEEGEWTIESSSCNLGAALHSLDWNGPAVYYGNYNMPFKLKVTTPASLTPGAPPAFSLRSGLTSTWGRIKAK